MDYIIHNVRFVMTDTKTENWSKDRRKWTPYKAAWTVWLK